MTIQGLINQMVYFAYFQSILLIFIYLFSAKNRKRINPFLAIFVIVLMIGLSGRVIYLTGIFGSDERWVVFSELATLFFGPTIYLFTKSSLTVNKYDKRDLLHYIAPIVYSLIVAFIFIILNHIQKPLFVILTIIGTALAINIVYYLKSLKIYLQFKKQIQQELSYVVKSQFFFNFLICVGFCMTCWLTLFLLGIIDIKFLPRSVWQLIWFCIAIIILFITYYGIQDPELYKLDLREEKPLKYAHSKFSGKDLDRLKMELEKVMISKKPFLNQKLLKSELADLMGISNPEMARLLNERIGMTYFEFVNYYRIKEFVELAKSEKANGLSIFGLAQESGFNSKTTFNKSFKQLMGMTPSAYFNQKAK